LEKGFKVKASMIFRGREMAHQDFGRKLLVQMTEDLTEFADVENASKMEGNNMHMLFAPKKAPTSK
jgi:translation initiation factor IF-3